MCLDALEEGFYGSLVKLTIVEKHCFVVLNVKLQVRRRFKTLY